MKQNFARSTHEGSGTRPDEYSISVRYERVDDEWYFVGRVAEFPDVAVYEEDAGQAYHATRQVVDDLLGLLRDQGRVPPRPQASTDEFSGRVTLRMPKSMHARVDAQATREGVSVNMLLVAAIERYLTSEQSVSYWAGSGGAVHKTSDDPWLNDPWALAAHAHFLQKGPLLAFLPPTEIVPEKQTPPSVQSCTYVSQYQYIGAANPLGIVIENDPRIASQPQYRTVHRQKGTV